MPPKIKLLISILVFAVAFIVRHFEAKAGLAHVGWVVLGLACLMVLAIWLFPEAKRKPGDPQPNA